MSHKVKLQSIIVNHSLGNNNCRDLGEHNLNDRRCFHSFFMNCDSIPSFIPKEFDGKNARPKPLFVFLFFRTRFPKIHQYRNTRQE